MPKHNYLKGIKVYLSGPMDFVFSREKEKKFGWRARLSRYLHKKGATVFDPWNKPNVRNFHEYGKEDIKTTDAREAWVFADNQEGAITRSGIARGFRETLHIDLRMVDLSDIVIAYCPTNVYSVGTPHEIVIARQQHKPVLFVSPPVHHHAYNELKAHLAKDKKGLELLNRVETELPIKTNPKAVPSLWYMPLVGAHNFFDGFGFALKDFQRLCHWQGDAELDENERDTRHERPLLPYLEGLSKGKKPEKWDPKLNRMVPDDDWLLLDMAHRIEK